MPPEESRAASEFDEADLLHHLLLHVPDRIYFKDLESRFLRINPALAERFGFKDAAEAIGKTDYDVHSEEHAREAMAEEQEIIRTGQPLVGKVQRIPLPDGRIEWAIATKMPLLDPSGTIIGTFGITRDFTELKNAQDALADAHEGLKQSYEELKQTQLQLIEAEKMSSVGRLAAGLAHEINNPLAMIKTGIDFLKMVPELAADADLQTVLGSMVEGVDRADAMVKRLLAFAAPRGLTLETHDVNQLVAQSLELLDHELAGSGVKIVREFAPHLPPATLDREKITQVLLHLFTNALHAMPAGGTLTIHTGVEELTDADVTQNAGRRHGMQLRRGDRALVVDVEDTGSGIAAENLSKLFEPFFTTKPTGQGAGLGLTVSRKIMELHHGSIKVESRPEGGVRASLRLKVGSGVATNRPQRALEKPVILSKAKNL